MNKRDNFSFQLHNNVAKFRKALGFTQATLADRVHITKGSLFKIEHGLMMPSIVVALQMARYLHTTVEELFGFEKSMVLSEEEKFDLEVERKFEKVEFQPIQVAEAFYEEL